jgi:mono/diheme cytochrome c family protein
MIRRLYIKLFDREFMLLCRTVTTFVLLLAFGCSTSSQPDGGSAPSVERGRELYGQLCQSCHGDAATGAGAVPTAPWHGPQGHTWHHPDGQLEAIILGEFTYPGRTMPSFHLELSREEVAAILAYLKEGWTPEQRKVQAEASKNWEQYQNGSQ